MNGISNIRAAETEKPPFDGVICFGGEDWWYHNRGHFDMQMMREMSQQVPVLYVNSIGMRFPSPREGGMFFRRVSRKVRSLLRGACPIRMNFTVLTPLHIPGILDNRMGASLLGLQVRRTAGALGMRRPLVWIACPPARKVLPYLHRGVLVYQRTDRFEEFTGVDRARIAADDAALKQEADLTIFCSRILMREEEEQVAGRTVFLDHGVDYERFASESIDEPDDLAGIPRPRVGFVGGIDHHTFDVEFFRAVVRETPELQYVLVGASSVGDAFSDLSNVHLLGKKDYEDVPAYMRHCDVLIMPWKRNEWINACNPVKLKEYLASGRPVVSTYFPELDYYKGHVQVHDEAKNFGEGLRSLCACDGRGKEERRLRVVNETWALKAEAVIECLSELHSLKSLESDFYNN